MSGESARLSVAMPRDPAFNCAPCKQLRNVTSGRAARCPSEGSFRRTPSPLESGRGRRRQPDRRARAFRSRSLRSARDAAGHACFCAWLDRACFHIGRAALDYKLTGARQGTARAATLLVADLSRLYVIFFFFYQACIKLYAGHDRTLSDARVFFSHVLGMVVSALLQRRALSLSLALLAYCILCRPVRLCTDCPTFSFIGGS